MLKVLKWRFVLAVGALALLTAVAGCGGTSQAPDDVGPLRLGVLLHFSEGAPGKAQDRQRAVEDSTLDPAKAVEAARRMVEVEGVHAIVGPSSSANSLMVVEQVTGPAGIPIVSPSATSGPSPPTSKTSPPTRSLNGCRPWARANYDLGYGDPGMFISKVDHATGWSCDILTQNEGP